jgi:hypothetical protein
MPPRPGGVEMAAMVSISNTCCEEKEACGLVIQRVWQSGKRNFLRLRGDDFQKIKYFTMVIGSRTSRYLE